MATKTINLTTIANNISSKSCSYTANTITTSSLSADTYGYLAMAVPLYYLGYNGCEDATINKVTMSFKGYSNRTGLFTSNCTVDSFYNNPSGSILTLNNYKLGKGSSDSKSITAEIDGSYLNSNIITNANGVRLVSFGLKLNNPINTGTTIIYITDLTITIDYTLANHTVTVKISPEGTGAVEGGGTYNCGATATLKAVPATGYKFVKWNDDVTTASRTVTVTSNQTYTAYFELDKINKISADLSQSKRILCDFDEVKAIIIDTTKVYV